MVAVKKDKINGDALGTGRRKSAVARVRIRPGNGQILINKRPLEDYFAIEQDRRQLTDTLELAGCAKSVDVVITVRGGGTTGQAGACKMGIARALVSYDMADLPAAAGCRRVDARLAHERTQEVRPARGSQRHAVLQALTLALVNAARSFRDRARHDLAVVPVSILLRPADAVRLPPAASPPMLCSTCTATSSTAM